jgi:hypothetical protein
MAVTATTGKTLKLRLLPNSDPAVKNLFRRLAIQDNTRAEFSSGNEIGIPCQLYHWGAGLVNLTTSRHLNKIVPVQACHSSSGMSQFLNIKQVNRYKFLDARNRLGILNNGFVPKELESCFDEIMTDDTEVAFTTEEKVDTEPCCFISKCPVVCPDQ